MNNNIKVFENQKQELIPISYDSDRPTVSARELHKFLEVGTKFQDWFPRMAEYGFVEGVDFNPLKIENVPSQKRERTYSITDYQLTIDMAKELCMIQRTEKGKQARQYFIQVEKNWNSPEQVMARALKMADAQMTLLKGKNKQLTEKVEQDKPKVNLANQISQSKDTISIGKLAKVVHDNHIKVGRNKLFKWLRDKKILQNDNTPYQIFIDHGYFKVVEIPKQTNYGYKIFTQTRVTTKGQKYIVNKLKDEFGIYDKQNKLKDV